MKAFKRVFIPAAAFVVITGALGVTFMTAVRLTRPTTWPTNTLKQLVYATPRAGTENRFTLRLNAGVLELRDDQNGSLLCSRRLDLTSSVAISGTAGGTNDTLTLDFSGGMFSVPDGIHFDGGVGGFDTLALRGGAVQNQRYDMTSPSDGVLTLDDTRVIFSNLEPVDDTTPAASLTIHGTSGGESITIADGGLVNGFTTTLVSSNTFESVRFANKTNVTVDGVAGTDTVNLNNANTAAGLMTLQIINVHTIVQSAPLVVTNFRFSIIDGSCILTNPGNDVDLLEGRGDRTGLNHVPISFRDVDDLTIGTVVEAGGLFTFGTITLQTGSTLTINNNTTASDSSVLTLNSGGQVTQTAPINASEVRFLGTGPFTLNHQSNFAPHFAANTNGDINFTVGQSIMLVDNVAGTTGVVSNNHHIFLTVMAPMAVFDTRPGPDVDAGTSFVVLIVGRQGFDDLLAVDPDAGIRGTGAIDLIADHMKIDAAINGSNFQTTFLRPFEEGTLMNLGGTDAPNTLGLTDAELDWVNGSVLGLGNPDSGTITVSAAISPANVNSMNLRSADGFTATGGGSLACNNLLFLNESATGRNWSIDPTSITESPGNPISYSGVSFLAVTSSGSGSDSFTVTPSVTTFIAVGAGGPNASPGDTLNVNLGGTTGRFLTAFTSFDGIGGSYSFANRQNVDFSSIETLLPAVDLSVTKTDGVNVIQPGGHLTYTIEAKNNGQLGLKSVPVLDTLPASLTNVSWTCSASPASACGVANGTGNISQQVSLAVGGTVTFTVNATVSSSASGTITNTATVNLPPGTSDPNLTNNSATDTTSIPTFSIDDVSIAEGNSGTVNAVFTVTLTPGLLNPTAVDYATVNGSATAPSDYTAVSGQLTFAPLQTTRTISVPIIGDTAIEVGETFTINLTNPIGAAIGDGQGIGTINEDDTNGTLQLSASANPVGENGGKVTITITRGGNTSLPCSVDYATSDATASQKGDYTIELGSLTFGTGETAKSFDVLLVDDAFAEGAENFNVTLLNATNGFVVIAPSPLVMTITDNDAVTGPNPLDSAAFYVRQQYLDFLNREPDAPGLAFWTNEITSCGADVGCIEVKRINVSAAFYLSIEFQETSGFVIRTNRAAFGKFSNIASSRLSYQQFIRDDHKVGEGVIVNMGNWQQQLEDNKVLYARQIAASPQFVNQYPLALTANQLVDALFASAGVGPTPAERQTAIDAFGGGGGNGRAAALRAVADSASVREVEFQPSFVLNEYFGYLRRGATDPPDADDSGYQFWLTKLNQFNGNYINAEMVKAFTTSLEYRGRFGPQ